MHHQGFFNDAAIISALSRLSADPLVPVIMTMAVLHIWTTEGGETTPSATDIAMFFKDKDEWLTTLDQSWSRIGLGLPLSPDFRRAAESFYKSCSDRLKCVSPLVTAAHASRAMKPAEALQQARLRQLAWVTSRMRPCGTPAEITTRNNPRMRLPKATDPSKMKPDLPGLTPQEASLLQIAVSAGTLSSHNSVLLHQAGAGFSEHFDTTARNMLGNLQPAAAEYCCLAWRRWRAHTKASPDQWKEQSLTQALFTPSEGAMAHYIGMRSGGGDTAAAGAVAGLSRCAASLGLNFPLDIAAVAGWSTKLRAHTVQPQIPIEVAELVHFDYHAKFNPSPFARITCATQWFSFLGTCRDAHIQRSFLVKKCDHAWLFYCIKGKDRSKPFHWTIPATTTAGSQGAQNMMEVVRATPPEGEEPYLIRQFGPNTKDPMAASHWRDRPMTGVQMMAARQNLLKEYPMCAKFNMSFTSYASRRAGTNLLAVINAEEVIRRAHGNWKACCAMPDVYTEDRLMISAKAKTLVVGVIQLMIKRIGKTDFRWGDIPSIVRKEDRDKILDDAALLYNDVRIPDRTREFVTQQMSLDLPAKDFLDADVWTLEGTHKIWEEIHDQRPAKETASNAPESSTSGKQRAQQSPESSDSESSASSIETEGEDVEADYLADINKIETAKLVTGKAKQSWVHVADVTDNGLDDRWALNCTTRLLRATATPGDLRMMQGTGKPFCPTCTLLWPHHIKKSLKVAVKSSLRGA